MNHLKKHKKVYINICKVDSKYSPLTYDDDKNRKERI